MGHTISFQSLIYALSKNGLDSAISQEDRREGALLYENVYALAGNVLMNGPSSIILKMISRTSAKVSVERLITSSNILLFTVEY